MSICNLGFQASFLLPHKYLTAASSQKFEVFSLEMCTNLWLSGDRFGCFVLPQLFQNNQPSTIWGRWPVLSSHHQLTVVHKHLFPRNQPSYLIFVTTITTAILLTLLTLATLLTLTTLYVNIVVSIWNYNLDGFRGYAQFQKRDLLTYLITNMGLRDASASKKTSPLNNFHTYLPCKAAAGNGNVTSSRTIIGGGLNLNWNI